MKQIKFGFAQPEATNHVFVCKHCDFWCEHKEILDIINKAKDGEF